MDARWTLVSNSLVFLQDEGSKDVPSIDGIGSVWRSKSALAVTCLPASEGETRLVLLDEEDVPGGLVSVFDETIETPSGWITVETLVDNLIFRRPASGATTRVRVWSNGHQTSDVIVMKFGG